MKNGYYFVCCVIAILLVLGTLNAHAQSDEQINYLRNFAVEKSQQWQQQYEETKAKAEELGLPMEQELSDGRFVKLAKFKNGMPVYYIDHNRNAAELSSVDALWPGQDLDLSLTGSNQTITMWETRVARETHVELDGRYFIQNTDADVSDHATHVAGTIIGSGEDSDAQGMAYEADLEGYDNSDHVSEMAQAAADGRLVANHSWGIRMGWECNEASWECDEEGNDEDWLWYGDKNVSDTEDYSFGFYNESAQEWDEIVENAPNFVIVKSAGNDRNDVPSDQPVEHLVRDPDDGDWVTSNTVRDPDGDYNSLGYRATAKNILTVGAVSNNKNMTTFSSWGPTNDGRIKPDIVADGSGLYSAGFEDDEDYTSKSGTSMSSPVVTGAVALLQQHYQDLYEEDPLASTMRALLLHTTDEMGGDPGPDYENGWGLLNAERAAQVLSDDAEMEMLTHIEEFTLYDGNEFEKTVWNDGEEPLKATIAWTDPAGEPVDPAIDADDRMLVNDLDLRITDENGNEYEPYILDPENPSHSATTGDNDRDNVEQVYIEAPPEAGYYTVNVSHKGSLEDNSQQASLIVTGNGNPLELAEDGHLELEGDGYAYAPNTPFLDISGDYITIEFWMKMDADSEEDAIIMSKKEEDDEGDDGYRIRTVGDGEERPLRFAPSDWNSRHITTNTGIRADEWTHIAAVYNDGDAHIYINGELDASQTNSSRSISSTANALVFGSNNSVNGQFFKGKLDDVRIWSTSRNMFEIQEDFAGPLEGDEDNLAAYYQFNQESQDVASDITGNGSDINLAQNVATIGPDVFPVTPLVHGKIANQAVELKIDEREFAEGEADQFRIYRSDGNGSPTEVETISANNQYYSDDGLTNGQTYFYKVTVIDEEGNESDYSNPIALTPNQRIGGNALRFEGQGFIDFSHRPGLNISGHHITIELWIKRDADSSGDQVILTNEDERGDDGYGLYMIDGGEEARIRFTPSDFSSRHVTSSSGIRADEWTHVSAVYNEGNTHLYINGKLDAESTNDSRSISGTSNNLTFGSNVDQNDKWFQGSLDEVRIWNKSRTHSEIEADFNQLLWGDESNLAGYWRFDETDGGIVYGQAQRPATSSIQGAIEQEDNGVFPVPPKIYAEPGEDEVALSVAQPPYAADGVENFNIYRYTEGENPTLITSLSADDTTYTDDEPESETEYFYEATIVDQNDGESDHSYPVTSTLYENRIAGNAVRFEENQSSYIQFEYNPALDISGDSITVEAWVLKDEASQEGAVILGNNAAGDDGYQLYINDEGASSRVTFAPTDFSSRHVTSQTYLEPGTWYHVAGVYNDGDSRIYINGALDNEDTNDSRSISSSSHGLVIGAKHLGTDDYFLGEVDEVRIWERALPNSDIAARYNLPLRGHEEGLVGYWRFDEPEGDLIRSSAIRPLHGELINGPSFVPSAAMEGNPFVPLLAAPEMDAEDEDIPVTFSWYPVDNAQHYELEVSKDLDFKSVIYEKEINDTTRTADLGLEYESTYHWRVRAVTNQFTTNWSEPWTFETLLPVPDAPKWDPDHEAEEVDTTVTFAWAESDFADTYRVQVDTDSGFDSPVVDSAGLDENELIVENLDPETTHYWRVSASNESGESDWSETREFTTIITSIADAGREIPEEFGLDQNYPNPFNPTTQIEYRLPENASVQLEVYNVMGEQVATLVNGEQKEAGYHTVEFEASGLSSGTYIYRIRAGEFVESRTMMFIK